MTKTFEILCAPLEALAEPAKNEPSETACRMAGTEIYDFEGGD